MLEDTSPADLTRVWPFPSRLARLMSRPHPASTTPLRPASDYAHTHDRECTGCGRSKAPHHFVTGGGFGLCNNCITRLKKYGLTFDQFSQMLRDQQGLCGVCRKPLGTITKRIAIDHDHACCASTIRTCGKCVRGLLCIPCNTGLGMFYDNPETLRGAIAYLEGADLAGTC